MNYDATSTPAINFRNGDLAFFLAHPVDVPPPMTVREARALAVSKTMKTPCIQETNCLEALSGSVWMNIAEIMHITGYCRVTCQKATSRLLEQKRIEKTFIKVRGTEKNIFRALAADMDAGKC